MVVVESEQKAKPVPFYTKAGGVAAVILMAIILSMMLRNCAGAVKYGSQTGEAAVETVYQLGMRDGQSDRGFSVPDEGRGNPVLQKAYNKGYREGLDKRHLGGQ